MAPADLDNQVNRPFCIVDNLAVRHLHTRAHHHECQPVESKFRTVCVDRCYRAWVAGIDRLKKIVSLDAADFAENDPVGAHSQAAF